jgi:hypothetical protein
MSREFIVSWSRTIHYTTTVKEDSDGLVYMHFKPEEHETGENVCSRQIGYIEVVESDGKHEQKK